MAVFDINNYPAQPDSNLDSDLSLSAAFVIQDEGTQDIAPGDWVDVDESSISPDPMWGFSFQVCNVYPDYNVIGILFCLNPGETEENRVYAETCLSPSVITNNFRRVPRTVIP
jgi:hypothetical protein